MEVCTAPGFQVMQTWLAKSADLVELYYLLFALLFDAQRIKELPTTTTKLDLNLNTICKYVFDKSFDSEQTLFAKINTDVSLDIVIILFSMIRTLMNPVTAVNPESSPATLINTGENNSENSSDYAIILLQIFRFMYHNCDDFHQLAAQQPEFLTALVATLYPHTEMTQQQLSTPLPVELRPFAEAICSPPPIPTSPTSADSSKQSSSSSSDYTTYLSLHPARKLVMDFLRDLTYDNMINSISATRLITAQAQSIVDIILTQSLAAIDTGNVKRHAEFTTEMLKTITDHLLASDIFNDSKSNSSSSNNKSPLLVTSSGFGSAASLQNLFNLIDRLVDKLWEGQYRRDSKEVFDMIVRLIGSVKKRFHTVSLEQMSNAMNRTLLYQLSRPCHSLTEQVDILDVLHKMTKMKQLIFATTNFQAEFFACVTHCLLQITQKNESEVDMLEMNVAIGGLGSGIKYKKLNENERGTKSPLSIIFKKTEMKI